MVNFSLEGKVALVTAPLTASDSHWQRLSHVRAQKSSSTTSNRSWWTKAGRLQGRGHRGQRLRLRRDQRGAGERHGGADRKRGRHRGHPRQQRRHHQAHPDGRDDRRGVPPGDRHRPQRPFIVSKAVIPSMIKKGKGKIINICSMMSELGRETVSATPQPRRTEDADPQHRFGVRRIQHPVQRHRPGYIATPQTAPLRERQADGSRHPFDSFIVAKTPRHAGARPKT